MGRKPQSRTTRASRGVALSPVWLSKRETKRKRSMPSSLAQIWCVRLGCVTGSKNCRRQAFIRSDSAITRWPWRSGIRSRRCYVAQFALFDNAFMRFSRTFDSILILPLITRQSPRNLIAPGRAGISRGSPVIDHLANLERVVWHGILLAANAFRNDRLRPCSNPFGKSRRPKSPSSEARRPSLRCGIPC
jgi:hypothetical protein